MTVLVGYSPHKDDESTIALACPLARSDGQEVRALTVVPQGWATTTAGDSDRDFVQWAAAEGEASAEEAAGLLSRHADVTSTSVWRSGRSVPAVLLDEAAERAASIVVVGSGVNGPPGYVAVTSKTDRLLHSSTVPVAIAPNGYAAGPQARVTRVTVGFRDDDATWTLLDAVAEICRRTGATLRIVTFAIQPGAMVSARVASMRDPVFDQWKRQARAAQAEAVAHLEGSDFPAESLEATVAEGSSWREVMHELSWREGDVLVVGSSSTHKLAQVFLGSSAAKILRNATVPVVVVP